MTKATVIIGAQWGDEGKGKLVDMLSKDADIVARCNGGANAGHTVVVGKQKFAFHLLPSGVLHPHVTCVIGNGVVLHLPTLFEEIEQLKNAGVDITGRLLISDRAHIVFGYHQQYDGHRESSKGRHKPLGTTKRGIGPTYAHKMERVGLRIGDLSSFERFAEQVQKNVDHYLQLMDFEYDHEKEMAQYQEYAELIDPMVVDTVSYLNKAYQHGKRILIEGANATMLDVDFGTYPYVTSSNTTAGGACTGLGLSPGKVGETYGIAKAYTTRVGGGPFPTELGSEEKTKEEGTWDKIHPHLTEHLSEAKKEAHGGSAYHQGKYLRLQGREYGTTTGRPRRTGWFDSVVLRYAHMINGFSALNLTKLDVLSGLETLQVATEYRLDGKVLESMPGVIENLERVEVKYEEMEGWTEDISGVRTFSELPENAKRYVKSIEELVGVGVKWIGVGAARDAMIER